MNLTTTDIQEIAHELLSLPLESRAYLAERLVDSVDNYASPDIETAWHDTISRRIHEYEEGIARGVPSEEVFATATRVK
ncbi:MAG: addiction module protein [Armatimonadetes bacterium]|nr:addiction module protein [Armatimonadota bacterium]PIY44789.1 MAG: hypothetical protein COZ05_07220 [Armatimonadetes bacterium CG_4_10_14_3_um_filter_59_10]